MLPGFSLYTASVWVVPVLIFVIAWMYLFRRLAERQGMGGFLNVGKSKAKVYMETDTKVTFDDVAGVDEAKEELQEVVRFLMECIVQGSRIAHQYGSTHGRGAHQLVCVPDQRIRFLDSLQQMPVLFRQQGADCILDNSPFILVQPCRHKILGLPDLHHPTS